MDLLGTIFSFPNLETDKERTRIIIFATDNDVNGVETVSLEDACNLCKEYKINLYAYCPTEEMNPYVSESKTNSYKTLVFRPCIPSIYKKYEKKINHH